jgi:ribosomal protein L37E
MQKTKKCNRCGVKVYSNQKNCSKCVDIILFGSVENARKVVKENFKKIGI